ncbi:hypothetical protein L0244_28655, partial [bacterium]|nr:hypothetical protein [bacterium]
EYHPTTFYPTNSFLPRIDGCGMILCGAEYHPTTFYPTNSFLPRIGFTPVRTEHVYINVDEYKLSTSHYSNCY